MANSGEHFDQNATFTTTIVLENVSCIFFRSFLNHFATYTDEFYRGHVCPCTNRLIIVFNAISESSHNALNLTKSHHASKL